MRDNIRHSGDYARYPVRTGATSQPSLSMPSINNRAASVDALMGFVQDLAALGIRIYPDSLLMARREDGEFRRLSSQTQSDHGTDDPLYLRFFVPPTVIETDWSIKNRVREVSQNADKRAKSLKLEQRPAISPPDELVIRDGDDVYISVGSLLRYPEAVPDALATLKTVERGVFIGAIGLAAGAAYTMRGDVRNPADWLRLGLITIMGLELVNRACVESAKRSDPLSEEDLQRFRQGLEEQLQSLPGRQ